MLLCWAERRRGCVCLSRLVSRDKCSCSDSTATSVWLCALSAQAANCWSNRLRWPGSRGAKCSQESRCPADCITKLGAMQGIWGAGRRPPVAFDSLPPGACGRWPRLRTDKSVSGQPVCRRCKPLSPQPMAPLLGGFTLRSQPVESPDPSKLLGSPDKGPLIRLQHAIVLMVCSTCVPCDRVPFNTSQLSWPYLWGWQLGARAVASIFTLMRCGRHSRVAYTKHLISKDVLFIHVFRGGR